MKIVLTFKFVLVQIQIPVPIILMSTAVLGGGLSGLSAVHYLSKSVKHRKIILVESSDRLGGWVKSSVQENGVIFEQGVRTIRPRGDQGANTLELIEELNLTNEVLPILNNAPAAKNRMIYAKGKLHSLPSSFGSLFRTQSPFNKPLISYISKDLFAKKETRNDDTVYNFVQRRFGTEVADYLISPLICGICAGNAKEISVKFLMKNLFEYEQKYGSISQGMIRQLFNKSKQNIQNQSKLVSQAKREKWNVYSFKNGCETLSKGLEESIKGAENVEIMLQAPCDKIEFTHNNRNICINCEDEDNNISSNYLISSLPALILAKCVKHQHPKLSELLNNIKFVTVGVVNLCYKGKKLKQDGFGFLVPPKENLPILGIIFDSCCFPNNCDCTVLTVMVGGYWFEKYFGENHTTENLLGTSKKYVSEILGITEDPVEYQVNLLENCIPQYTEGHFENVEKIEKYIKQNYLPIYLCGSSYHGVGVNDVILSARNAAKSLSSVSSTSTEK